jgi:cytochrome c oxidase cbb3-type subunit 2
LSKLIVALSLAAAGGLMLAVSSAVLTKEDPAARGKKSFFEYSATTGNIEPVGESPPVTPRLIEHGRWVFRGLCIGCHGAKGDGNGAVWELGDKYAKMHKLPRKPRDFTSAVFKVRSTPSGSLPTDKDLFKAISRGLVADQDMPAFQYLPERDRWAVVAYIKTLSPRWQEEKDYQEPPVEVGEPPIPDEASIQAGKLAYAEMKCAKCHGELGKGDGPSAPELTDDNGLSIKPRDFSDASQFVGGSDPRGVYQTFTTGLDGTPMPTFADFLNEQKRWHLVWYVMSLRPSFDLEKTRRDMLRERGGKLAEAGAGSGK